MSKVFITGINGYIASNLAKKLLDNGWMVSGSVRPSSDLSSIQTILKDLKLFIYNRNCKDLIKFLEKLQPEFVVHLASRFIVQHTTDQIDDLVDTNILFSTHLAESMHQTGIKKIINTTTSWQHYNNEIYNPANLYAATKEACSSILKYYHQAHGLRVIELELFDTYGPNDTRPKLINLLMNAFKKKEILNMSPGEQYIDLVYIDDVISAYCVALDLLKNSNMDLFKTYTVNTGKPIQLKKLVSILENVIGDKININWGGRAYRDREVMTAWSEGQALPNWTAQIDLNSGLGKILKK